MDKKILLIIVIVILLFVCGNVLFYRDESFSWGLLNWLLVKILQKVKDSFWERYNMDYDVFCSTYTIEKS